MVGAQGWSGLSAAVGEGAYTSLRGLKLGEINLGINVVPERAACLPLRSVNKIDAHIFKDKFGMSLNDEFKEIKIRAKILFFNTGYWANMALHSYFNFQFKEMKIF